MIHPPDVIPKYAPDATIGSIGEGGCDEDDDDDGEDAGGYTMQDVVAKHTVKGDCWIVVAGQVLNVSIFVSQHPGDELAIATFAGKYSSYPDLSF